MKRCLFFVQYDIGNGGMVETDKKTVFPPVVVGSVLAVVEKPLSCMSTCEDARGVSLLSGDKTCVNVVEDVCPYFADIYEDYSK